MDVERNIKIVDILPIYTYGKILNANCFYNVAYGVVIAFTINNNPRVSYLRYQDIDIRLKDGNKKLLFSKLSQSKTLGVLLIKQSKVCMNAYPIADKEAFLKEGKRRINYENILNIIYDEQKNRKALQSGKKEKIILSF